MENFIVKLPNGFEIDIFETESGSLGMTVTYGDSHSEDTPSVDIFVDDDLTIRHG